MSLAVVLNTHENSDVFKDTLDSILYYLTDQTLVVVDGLGWKQFSEQDFPCYTLNALSHGQPSAPVRNVALGLMKAWEIWGKNVDWYCYLEYDCLIGSNRLKDDLYKAHLEGYWVLGNDLRKEEEKKIEVLNHLCKTKIDIYYLLGCCNFYNSNFIEILSKNNFFDKFLNFTNFYNKEINLTDKENKTHSVYDLSEFMYPSLAVHYGGKIKELACWKESEQKWIGNISYPMRFRPDLTIQDPFQNAFVMHPLKEFENPVRNYHRKKRISTLDNE